MIRQALKLSLFGGISLASVTAMGVRCSKRKVMTAVKETPLPIIICGPSGVGKSTLLKRLFKEYPTQFGFSVSHTTRDPRKGEVDGVSTGSRSAWDRGKNIRLFSG